MTFINIVFIINTNAEKGTVFGVTLFLSKEKNTMKMRRTVIVAFLLLAVLVMGVGYAAVSGSLTVNGKATVGTNAAGYSVIFVGTPAVTPTVAGTPEGTATAVIRDSDKSIVDISIPEKVLVTGDDLITVVLTAENQSEDYKSLVKGLSIGNDKPTNFEISITHAGETTKFESTADGKTTATLNTLLDVYSASEDTDQTIFTITIKLIQPPTDGKVDCDFKFIIEHEAKEKTYTLPTP